MNWYTLTPEDLAIAGVEPTAYENCYRRATPEPGGMPRCWRQILIGKSGWVQIWLYCEERDFRQRYYKGRFVDREHFLNTLRGIAWLD